MTVLVAFVALVAATGYVVFTSSAGPGGSTTSVVRRCAPPTSPVCIALVGGHDAALEVPFALATTGAELPVTAVLPPADVASSYDFSFGDSSFAVATQATVDHQYSGPGSYLLSVVANVSGHLHDNDLALVPETVQPSFALTSDVERPAVRGWVTANSTSTQDPTGILQPGQTFSVEGTYAGAPVDPNSVEIPLTIQASAGGTILSATTRGADVGAVVSFAASGPHEVVLVGGATNQSTGARVFANYTWSVFVAPAGVHAGTAPSPTAQSLHPGALDAYELFPGGAASLDPAIDYEAGGEEPILNVYQTLVGFNGSRTGSAPADFVPVLATCVPGSAACERLYGSSLVSGENYTVVLQGNASFYDPTTAAHWGVWPTDVVFSIARTVAFSTLPTVQWNNGWILAQALLGTGNASWDGALHAPYNTTPQSILGSMSINETGFCTPAMEAPPNHGCVTFHADGGGGPWPNFLELIADPLGGSVVPCGWFSAPAQGAGIPYWTAGNVSGAGDHPCPAPGALGYGVAATDPALPATGWDPWEVLSSGALGVYVGNVQFAAVGSGPYDLSELVPASSYSLATNPFYGGAPECAGPGCPPAPGTYAASVSVTWESTATPGETALINGAADVATIPPADYGLLRSLAANGTIAALTSPSLTLGVFALNLDVPSGTSSGGGNSTAGPNALAYVGLRQFLVHAYPYRSIATGYSAPAGLEYATSLGGVIPSSLGTFAPTNISWPSGDPNPNPSVADGAAWWWAQTAENTSSPYFDPGLSACTASAPCTLPLGPTGGIPYAAAALGEWASQVSNLSQGRLVLTTPAISFSARPGVAPEAGGLSSPYALYGVGWVPDFTDPSDYTSVLYGAAGLFPLIDSVASVLGASAFNASTCPTTSSVGWWAEDAATAGVPTSCQGPAYAALNQALAAALHAPAGFHRDLLYTMAEQIANALALYVTTGQGFLVDAYAPYVSLASANVNPLVGGGEIHPWYDLTGTSGPL